MRFEHIDRKMPRELRELIMEQKWCSSFLKQGLALPDLLTDQKYLAELNRHLSLDEKHTLRLIVSAFGCEPFTRDALEKQAVLRMAGAQVALGLVGLRRAGVIAAFRKAWGEQLFILPEDAFAAWQLLLFPSDQLQTGKEDMALELWEAGSSGQLNTSDEAALIHPRGLAQQLFHFLAACNQQSSLPLTNKGTLHKKQLQKLTEHLALPNEILRSAGLTYAFRDVYDEPAALMIEMAIHMGFLSIHSQGDRYLFNQQACLRWLQDSYDRQQAQLYQIWRQLLVPAPVWLEHGISLMERGESGQWYELDTIAKGIRSCCSLGGQVTDESSLHKAIMTTWLTPLSVFRFIELGTDKEGRPWFRWLITPIQQASKDNDLRSSEMHVEACRSLYVQPDFEMLLPPDVSLRTEWDIAAFADLQTTDLVRTYRVTKESFYRAWEKGMSSDEMIRVLNENSLYEVPTHITITLQQWGEQAGKLYIEEVTLLRCRSEDIAEALLRNEKCLPLLGERVGGSDFIVLREHLTVLTKCLEGMGFHPRSSRKNENTVISNTLTSSENQTGGLCYSRDTIQLYEMDTHLPERDELYPDMQDIPVSWIKEFREYHGSTRKEMIRKAIEWKSVLQLRKEGRNRFIIPRILREERSGWILEGLEEYQEISLASEDWEEMKLILPGINDEGVYS